MKKLVCVVGVLMLGACGQAVKVGEYTAYVRVEDPEPAKGFNNPVATTSGPNIPMSRLGGILPKATEQQTGCTVIDSTVRWIGLYNSIMSAEIDCSAKK